MICKGIENLDTSIAFGGVLFDTERLERDTHRTAGLQEYLPEAMIISRDQSMGRETWL